MSAQNSEMSALQQTRPNGSGAAAILAAGIGAFMIAFIAIATDKSAPIKNLMTFYKPTGPISGVTTCAIIVWLVCWIVLDRLWRGRDLGIGKINAAALMLLALALLFTFPPIADLL